MFASTLLSPEGLAQVPAGEQGEDAAPVAGELPPVGQPFQLRRAGGARRQALGAMAVERGSRGAPGCRPRWWAGCPTCPAPGSGQPPTGAGPGYRGGGGCPGWPGCPRPPPRGRRRAPPSAPPRSEASLRSWVMMRKAVPSLRFKSRISAVIPWLEARSRAPVGSSSSTRGGLRARALASRNFCTMPPDSSRGVAGQIPLLQPHQGHQLPRPPGQGLPPVRPAQHLLQVLRQGEGGVEPLRRGLEGEGELPHPQGLPVALLHPQQLPAVEEYLAADLGHGVGQAGDGPGQGGLAAARLPHQGQDLPPVQGEAHRVEGELRKGDR